MPLHVFLLTNACKNSLLLIPFKSMPAGIPCLCPSGLMPNFLKCLCFMHACRHSLFLRMPFRSHLWCTSRPISHECLQAILVFVCPIGLTSGVLTGLYFMNACSISLFYALLSLISNVLQGLFLMNARSNSSVLISFRSHSGCPSRPIFHGFLQFIDFDALFRSRFWCPYRPFLMKACRHSLFLCALQVWLLISLKAWFSIMP